MKRKIPTRYGNNNAWKGLSEPELRRYVEMFWGQLNHYLTRTHDLEMERLHLERRVARQRGMLRRLQELRKREKTGVVETTG
jgi:hypothetical protein